MDEIRLDIEKDFHNKRFEEGDDRQAQMKYYWAVANGADRYWNNVKLAAPGARILEYGCAMGGRSEELAGSCASYDGIDISDVAIDHATSVYGRENVRFHVMDAMHMTFPDNSFDLIFGSGIIHHLDTEQSIKEIRRVLSPRGQALFWEPLGLNPLINLYRTATPSARTPDEHPLLPQDFRIMQKHFGNVNLDYFGLTTLGAVPFRNSKLGPTLKAACETIDSVILAVPGLRNIAWYSLISLRP
jgi:SAM-dependent methyltransferase